MKQTRTLMAGVMLLALCGSTAAQPMTGSATGVAPVPPAVAAEAGRAMPGESIEQIFLRGYQRGYAEAMSQSQYQGVRPSDAGRQPTPQWRACMRLRVLDARWTDDQRACDATRAVADFANGRAVANVQAGNGLCGDPAPGRRKALQVEYAGGDPAYCGNEVRTAAAPEGRAVQLVCGRR
jgi:hypothetical protein